MILWAHLLSTMHPQERQSPQKADITSTDLEFLLESLPSIGNVAVSRTSAFSYGYVWDVTFMSNLGNVPALSVDFAGLSGSDLETAVSEFIQGATVPTSYIIGETNGQELTVGESYFVRVSLANEAGDGRLTSDMQTSSSLSRATCSTVAPYTECAVAPMLHAGVVPLAARVSEAPGAPGNLAVAAVSASQLRADWSAPADNGNAVSGYRVEFFTSIGDLDVQRVEITNDAADTLGTFTLSYAGETTKKLSYDSTDEDVEDALNSLNAISKVSVAKSPITDGSSWSVTFDGDLGPASSLAVDDAMLVSNSGGTIASNVVPVTAGTLPADYGVFYMNNDAEGCGGTIDSVAPGVCSTGTQERQTIVVEGSDPVTGDFAVSYEDATPVIVSASSTSLQLQTALRGLHTDLANVNVLRHGPLNNGYVWFVDFLKVLVA